MSIYNLSDNGIEKVPETTFKSSGILERTHLQNYLRDNIEIISENTLVISEEFSEWDNSNRRIDLLGIDKDANLIIIELKRTESGDHMELQAIRYASMISTLNFQKCVDIYQKYLDQRNIEENAQENLMAFLNWETPLEEDFALDVKIVLASADFSKELTTSVMWLIDKGLDITCIKLRPYLLDEQLLLDINQIIPLPEAESYLIKVKEKSVERKIAINSSRDKTKYLFNDLILGKGKLSLEIVKEFIKHNPDLSYNDILNKFPKETQGSIGVINTLQFISEKYSHTPVKRHFLKDEDTLTSGDKIGFAVCSQWGIGNIDKILKIAEGEKYEIELI